MLNLTRSSKQISTRLAIVSTASRAFSKARNLNPNYSKYLIVGAGNAGVTVAANLPRLNKVNPYDIRIIDSKTKVAYEPGLDLIPSKTIIPEGLEKSLYQTINSKIKIHAGNVIEFRPENNIAVVEGREFEYDYLILATGLTPDYDAIKGLEEALSDPESGVCSTIDLSHALNAKNTFDKFSRGTALFYNAGFAARNYQSAINNVLLFDEEIRENRGTAIRELYNLEYFSTFGTLFPLSKNSVYLKNIFDNRKIKGHYGVDLVEVDKKKNKAVFVDKRTGTKAVRKYDLLFVSPPYRPDSVVAKTKEITNEDGRLNINPKTLVHNKYKNIMAIGHATRTPEIYSQKSLQQQSSTICTNLKIQDSGKDTELATYEAESEIPIFVEKGKVLDVEWTDPRLETLREPSRLRYYNEVYVNQVKFFNLQVKDSWF